MKKAFNWRSGHSWSGRKDVSSDTPTLVNPPKGKTWV